MISCAMCGFENIEGADVCDQCGQPINESHLRSPKNAVERGLLNDQIDTLAPKTPIAIKSDATVQEALTLLRDKHIGCVLVVDGDVPVGVFSERDALMKIGNDIESLRSEPISRFMTENPVSLPGETRIAFAVHKMDIGGYRHLPILDENGKAEGVISARDILRYLSGKMAEASG